MARRLISGKTISAPRIRRQRRTESRTFITGCPILSDHIPTIEHASLFLIVPDWPAVGVHARLAGRGFSACGAAQAAPELKQFCHG